MIPYIVEDVLLSRSHAWLKYVKAWAECRRQQWNYLIVENNDKENNIDLSS